MAETKDVIVIGLGVGGEEVAGRCAEAGLEVLGVERNLVGGECPYWGCIPSKIAVRAALAVGEAKRIDRLAGSASVDPDWGPVAARIIEATAWWDDSAAVERLERKGVIFVRGEARLVDPGAVEVNGTRYSAERGIVLATGGEPAPPPIEGLESVAYWTNREALEATDLPSSLVVLGAGAVGLELAQAFSRLGSRVSVIEAADRPLPMEEPENGRAMSNVLAEDGIELFTGVSASSIRNDKAGVLVELGDGSVIEGERLLVATGRRSDLQSLGVENAGLDPSAKHLVVDEHLRVQDGLWGVGDVTGKAAFTHVAVYQGRVAAADILGENHTPADYSAVPRVTFTDPEVASVGLTEQQAKDKGLKVRTGTAQTASSARGWIHGPGAEHGVLKLVADRQGGFLVGASAMGPSAGEVIGLLIVAVKERIPLANLRELIYPYPTFLRGLEDALRELA